MQKIGLTFLLVSILGLSSLMGQQTDPLAGKTIAVYFSKKAYHFDRPYHHYLSQFIGAAEGEDILIDDLKLQSLIAIGKRFAAQLGAASEADSAFFLNEQPEMARAFIEGYSIDQHDMLPLGSSFTGVDLVLVVNPFQLFSERRPVVLTRSNRLVTKYDNVKKAKLSTELWDPSTGRLIQATETCMEHKKKGLPELRFDFQGDDSQTGRFLEYVFTVAVDRMASSADSNCPPPPPKDEYEE